MAPKKKKRNSVKYKLSCRATDHLTTYNPDHNNLVREACWQEDKFIPAMDCFKNGEKCKYLDITKYG